MPSEPIELKTRRLLSVTPRIGAYQQQRASTQSIEFRTRIILAEARRECIIQDRLKGAVEEGIVFRPRPALTPLEKFRTLKLRGSRGEYSEESSDQFFSSSPPPAFPPPPIFLPPSNPPGDNFSSSGNSKQPVFGEGWPTLVLILIIFGLCIWAFGAH